MIVRILHKMLWKTDSPADLLYRHAVLGGAVAGPAAVGTFQAGGKVEDDGEDGIAGEGGQVVETAPEIEHGLLNGAAADMDHFPFPEVRLPPFGQHAPTPADRDVEDLSVPRRFRRRDAPLAGGEQQKDRYEAPQMHQQYMPPLTAITCPLI